MRAYIPTTEKTPNTRRHVAAAPTRNKQLHHVHGRITTPSRKGLSLLLLWPLARVPNHRPPARSPSPSKLRTPKPCLDQKVFPPQNWPPSPCSTRRAFPGVERVCWWSTRKGIRPATNRCSRRRCCCCWRHRCCCSCARPRISSCYLPRR